MNDSVSEHSKQPTVSLVIPGRNCAATLEKCLNSVVPLWERGELQEIIFVNDGSTDNSAEIAAQFSVRVIQGEGLGPGAARNLGWRSSDAELIWFIDSDCVSEPDALTKLLPHLENPEVAGVGGSYQNLYPDSLLATLIHEEIIVRHRRMGHDVNFLATFNVLYRRRALKLIDGFNESLKLAQDAELAFRMRKTGYLLRFEIESRVGHHHPRRWLRYLRTQCCQGYYRVMLYRQHPAKMGGDSYAGLSDYLQPILAAGTFFSLPCLVFSWGWILPMCCVVGDFLLQIPLTVKLLRQAGPRMLAYPIFGFVRSYARAVGMLAAVFNVFWKRFQLAENTRNEAEATDHELEVNHVISE